MKNIQDSVIAFCDFETTGLCHQYDRIVQSAIVVHSFPEGKTIRHLDLLTNPGSIIPSESANIHGIKTEDVAGKEMLSAQVGTLFDMFEGVDYVCAYNGI